MKTMPLMLALVVFLALALSAHGFTQVVSIPVIGETTGKAIEGNPQMVISATPETGRPFEFDTIPTIPQPMGIRMDVTLLNMAVRPEADATLGVAIGVGGLLDYGEWRGRSAADKHYNEKSRGELRRAHLGSVDQPGRWITAIRTGEVEYREQKRGQNGPLMFTAYIEPVDLHPGTNVFIVRFHGIMEQRTTRFLLLGKDGKAIFGTYDEPWLVMVGDVADDRANETFATTRGDYVTTQELQLALDSLKEEIRTMIVSQPRQACGHDEGGDMHVIWDGEETEMPPAPEPDLTSVMPVGLGLNFSVTDGASIRRTEEVKVTFSQPLPRGSHVWFAIFVNGQWWPWKEVATSYVRNGRATFSFDSERIKPGPASLAVAVRNNRGEQLGFGQLNLNLEDR